jgi:alkyldihydroxyacetonephosphate synthase
MRRWNGWGDDDNALDFALNDAALRFLGESIGPGNRLPDATLAQVIDSVPASRLPPDERYSIDPEDRVRHARGQSLPDWLALRSGDFGVFPDAVAFPETGEEVRALLALARAGGVDVIPYGGGTSVVGHINPEAGERPVLTISLARMNQLLELDKTSQIATFGAGTPGPAVESQLAEHGYTLGHFPQSWELSTIGGWVASRSSGQQSLRYGRIEGLFAGGSVETFDGTLELPTFPATSAGPDLREFVLGTEGRLGIITQVKARVTPLPEHESFHVLFFPSWEIGLDAVRAMVQGKLQLSMMRLSNANETFTQLKLAGGGAAVALLEKYLGLRGAGEGRVMFTFGTTGSLAQCRAALALTRKIARQYGAVGAGGSLGKRWEHSRFRSPYLRHGLWEAGYAVDTMETAVDWARVPQMAAQIEDDVRNALADEGEKVHAFTHLSHLYGQGSSVYTTYIFRCGETYEQTHARWAKLKAAGANAIVRNGGTISHQHGVGKDHTPYIAAEKGELGLEAIAALLGRFDPDGQMNPGKLLP